MTNENEMQPEAPVLMPEPAIPGVTQSVTPDLSDNPIQGEVDEIERKFMEDEIKSFSHMARGQKGLSEAQAKKEAALAKILPASEDVGYGVKVWNGHTFLQCLYCPLDVPLADEDRMKLHMQGNHPTPRGNPKYDNFGNALPPEESE